MRLVSALACLLLAACSPADGEPPAPLGCAPMPLEGRYVTVDVKGCPGCALKDEKQAVDGDVETFATARIPARTEGPLSLRAGNLGRQPEAARAAGAIVQVVQGRLDYDEELALLITLRGTPQASTLGFKPEITTQGGLDRLSFEAPVAFDELELRLFQRDHEEVVVQVHELCRA